MDISYLGHSSFRIKGRAATVVTDPYDSKMTGLKFPKVSADIVTVSHDHNDHNQAELVDDVKKVVKGPGEYEIMGVSIIGINTFHDAKKGIERGRNVIYVFEMDDIRLAHLGDLGHELSDELIEEIGTIDILMVPVGGFYTIDSVVAAKVVRDIEASIVIPMHFSVPDLSPDLASKLSPVENFLKETGLLTEKMEKLSVKKSEIPEEGQKIVVLLKK